MNLLALNLKRSISFLAFTAAFSLVPVNTVSVSALHSQLKIPLKQSWTGQNLSRDLQAAGSLSLYIADETSCGRLWQTWRGEERLPKIDFTKGMIVFCTTSYYRGENG
jgi:hypothetical protein